VASYFDGYFHRYFLSYFASNKGSSLPGSLPRNESGSIPRSSPSHSPHSRPISFPDPSAVNLATNLLNFLRSNEEGSGARRSRTQSGKGSVFLAVGSELLFEPRHPLVDASHRLAIV